MNEFTQCLVCDEDIAELRLDTIGLYWECKYCCSKYADEDCIDYKIRITYHANINIDLEAQEEFNNVFMGGNMEEELYKFLDTELEGEVVFPHLTTTQIEGMTDVMSYNRGWDKAIEGGDYTAEVIYNTETKEIINVKRLHERV